MNHDCLAPHDADQRAIYRVASICAKVGSEWLDKLPSELVKREQLCVA
jgi:hypothetical protein